LSTNICQGLPCDTSLRQVMLLERNQSSRSSHSPQKRLGMTTKYAIYPKSCVRPYNILKIPWALRGLISDPRCQELFGKELMELRNTFDDWHPKTSAMKEVRKKLEPIRGRRSRFAPDPFHHLQSPLSAAPSASSVSPVFTKPNNR
jgi:hypothetical protein